MLIVKFYILENKKKGYYSFKFIIISKFYIVEIEKMLLFINNFFNIERKKKKLFKKLVKKFWLVLKLNVFFIISKQFKTKKKKKSGHPVNCGLAQSGRELTRSGPKMSEFKRARKIKAIILNFFRLNGPARGSLARLTALFFWFFLGFVTLHIIEWKTYK